MSLGQMIIIKKSGIEIVVASFLVEKDRAESLPVPQKKALEKFISAKSF